MFFGSSIYVSFCFQEYENENMKKEKEKKREKIRKKINNDEALSILMKDQS